MEKTASERRRRRRVRRGGGGAGEGRGGGHLTAGVSLGSGMWGVPSLLLGEGLRTGPRGHC